MTVTLLGPQRVPTVDGVVRRLDLDGAIATVTAGWREREGEDAELDELLGARSLNLALYRRWLDVQERDPHFCDAQHWLRQNLDELQEMYRVRVQHTLSGIEVLQRAGATSPRRAAEITDAVAAIRALDERHARLVSEIYTEFYDTWRPQERPVLGDHRDRVAELLRPAAALCVAGGHVGTLSFVLNLFDVTAGLDSAHCPVIAWSAGAMVLTERIVLFHDRTPQGPTPPEILARGLSLVPNVVALPHARGRLLIDDRDRMAVFARRFAPARCLLLEPDMRIDFDGSTDLPDSARVLTEDGHIQTLRAA